MFLPDLLKVHVIDSIGNANPIGNLIFDLKVFMNTGGWFNSLPLKTDPFGQITLSRQDIQKSIGLHEKDYPFAEKHPTRFELCIWSKVRVAQKAEMLANMLRLYDDENFVNAQIYNAGVGSEQFKKSKEVIKNKAIEEKAMFDLIVNSQNGHIVCYTNCIKETWTNNDFKEYQFVVEKL